MILEKKEATILVTPQDHSITDLVHQMQERYAELQDSNLILNLLAFQSVTQSEFERITRFSKHHKASLRSCVVVIAAISYDKTPDEVTWAPTLQEAHDLIEIEEIERDLGL